MARRNTKSWIHYNCTVVLRDSSSAAHRSHKADAEMNQSQNTDVYLHLPTFNFQLNLIEVSQVMFSSFFLK